MSSYGDSIYVGSTYSLNAILQDITSYRWEDTENFGLTEWPLVAVMRFSSISFKKAIIYNFSY